MFDRAHRRRSIYAGLFWAAQVGPLFAIFTFITPVLDGIGLPPGSARDVLMNVFQLAGAVAFIWIVGASKRRSFVIITFAVMLGCLLVLGLFQTAPLLVLVIAIGIFLAIAAGASNLQFVYPSEMFETRLRSTGVGFAASMSRIGGALATYLLPVAMAAFGTSAALLLLAVFPLAGLLASMAWAPETKDVKII